MRFLTKYLGLSTFSQAVNIIEKFFDLNQIRGEVREYLLDELGDYI
jgi:hypothetical protein